MAHGKPDWGANQPTKTIYQLSDLGELAARLGSINTFDRRGDVVWMEDFEDNIAKWQLSLNGAGAAVALSADNARNGGKCCKVTTGDTTNDYAGILRRIGPSAIVSQMGLEVSFILNHEVKLYINISAYLDTMIHQCYFRYNPTDKVLQYNNDAGAWVDLLTGLELKESDAWHTIKMVADFTGTGDYIRLMLDSLTPDVDMLPMRVYQGAGADHILIHIQCQSITDDNHDMYLDDVIVTQNEP